MWRNMYVLIARIVFALTGALDDTIYGIYGTMPLQGTAFSLCVECVLYSMQCTVYNVQCAVHNLQCAVYNVQYAV